MKILPVGIAYGVLMSIGCSCLNLTGRHTNARFSGMGMPKIHPVKYRNWREKKFENLAVAVSLPEQAEIFSADQDNKATIVIHFLPLYQPLAVAENSGCATVRLIRLPKEEMTQALEEVEASDSFKHRMPEDKKCIRWGLTFNPKTTAFDTPGDVILYRRDLDLENGEIVHATATVIKIGSPSNIQNDRKAIKRILDSIRPLTK